jgi:hypothetical protein
LFAHDLFGKPLHTFPAQAPITIFWPHESPMNPSGKQDARAKDGLR